MSTDVEYSRNVAAIACMAHEINRAYCAGIGDLSQVAWDDAPDWQKESAYAGVEYTLNNPDAKPSDSHVSWLKQKEEDGWMYGPVKDADKKEHPCYVPYEDLPTEQKVKDYLFQATVRTFTMLDLFKKPDEVSTGFFVNFTNDPGVSKVDTDTHLARELIAGLDEIKPDLSVLEIRIDHQQGFASIKGLTS